MEVTNPNYSVPLVIGVSILDISMAMNEDMPTTMDGAMYHTKSAQSAGGVGRNLADSIYKLYGKVNFISLIGNDHIGEILLRLMPEALWERIIKENNLRTSLCNVLFDKNGDCKLILGDMEIHKSFASGYLIPHTNLIKMAPLIIIDGNLPLKTIGYILTEATHNKIPVFYEPTDLRIAGQPFKNLPPFANTTTHAIRIISPNFAELKNIIECVEKSGDPLADDPDFKNIEQVLKITKSLILSIHHLFDCIVVTLGQHGVILCLNSTIDPYTEPLFSNRKYVLNQFEPNHLQKSIIFFPTPEVVADKDIVNVSGAGDSFSGGFISGLLREYTVCQAIALGFKAARAALLTTAAVPETYFSMTNDLWHARLESLQLHGRMNEREL